MRATGIIALIFALSLVASPALALTYTPTGYVQFNVVDIKKEYFNSETSITFDRSEDNQAITLIHFKVPQGHQVDFEIHYGTEDVAYGYATNEWNVSYVPPKTTQSTIHFNGETKSYDYFDTNPEYDYYLSGYARASDNTSGIMVYNAGYGSFDNDLGIFMAVPNLGSHLIYKVVLTCDYPFDADITYGSYQNVADSVSKGPLEIALEWMNFAIEISSMVKDFALGFIKWIKFFFVDHLLFTVTIYMTMTMAFAARNSRGNISKFLRTWFSDQRKFFEFIVTLWHMLVSTISSFRQIFF